MNNLVNAYHNNDIKTFEKILKDNKKTILDDPVMKDYSDDLLRNIRTQVMLKILSPYTKIRIHFVSQVGPTIDSDKINPNTTCRSSILLPKKWKI